MNFPKPRIIDTTLQGAIEAGCDCVMLKHDGFPATLNCAANVCTIVAHWTPWKEETIDHVQLIEPLDALLVGAKHRLDPVIHIHDCWWMRGQDVQHLSYRERYVLARTNCKSLDDRFRVVTVLPITQAETLWTEVIKNPQDVKGLVFRRSRDTAAGDLYVRRYYENQPWGLND